MSPHGGPPPTPLALKAVELLEDGEWHDLDQILVELGKLVPPGRAMRRAEIIRQNSSNAEKRKKNRDERLLIATGRRSIAKDTLNQRHYYEIDPPGKPGGAPAGFRQRIRLIKVPSRVEAYRRSQHDGAGRPAAEVIADMLRQDHPKLVLGRLTRPQVERVALELLHWVKEGEPTYIQEARS